jgi:hypothetical protein
MMGGAFEGLDAAVDFSDVTGTLAPKTAKASVIICSSETADSARVERVRILATVVFSIITEAWPPKGLLKHENASDMRQNM